MRRFPQLVRHLANYRDPDTGLTLLNIGDAVASGTWEMGPRLYEEVDYTRAGRGDEVNALKFGGGYGE